MTGRRWPWLLLALCASALCCHGLLLNAPFIYDDAAFILADGRVTGPWPGWAALFGRTFAGGEYEPLVALTHWALYRVFGEQPFPFRLTSLLLHWANVWLLWRLLRARLDERLALGAAALFAAFPAHVEVLAVSTFKKHLLSAFFGLALLNLQEERRFARLPRALLGAACLALALLCKESGLVFVPLAAAASLSRRGARGRHDFLFLGALALTAAAYALLRLTLLPREFQSLNDGAALPYLLTSGKILLWHLVSLLAPLRLSLEHGLEPVRRLGPEAAAVTTGALAWLGFGAWLWRRDREAAFGWTWASLTLAPFLNLLPYLNFSLVANRYQYLAYGGFTLLLGRLAGPALRPAASGGDRRVALAALLPFVAYCALGARFAGRFNSPYELWLDAERSAPDNPRVQTALGMLHASWNDRPAAERALRRAIALEPRLPEAYPALSWLLAATNRGDEALELARRRLALRADSTGEANLGLLLTRAGRFAEALPFLERAAALAPGPDASVALGHCLLGLGRLDEAQALLLAASADPALEAKVYHGLGEIELRRGRDAAALPLLERSLRAQPVQLEVVALLARLDRRARRPELARRRYDELLARLQARAGAVHAETPEQEAAIGAYLDELITQASRARDAR